ncbi:MAG: hypothetical protein ACOX32_06950 [Bacteroidaceae bacterium]
MTIAILFHRFVKYTHRVTAELGIKANGFRLDGALYGLPAYKKRPVIFIPMAILTDLPRHTGLKISIEFAIITGD